MTALVRIRNVTKTFGTDVRALQGVSFDVEAGTMVALAGRSGSGKTTLLNVVGGLDRPDEGSVLVDGVEVTSLDEDGLSKLRRERVAYVFQTFGLIPVLSAAENVGAPLRLARVAAAEREKRVALLLDLVGRPARTVVWRTAPGSPSAPTPAWTSPPPRPPAPPAKPPGSPRYPG